VNRIISDQSLDDALNRVGVSFSSGLFRIEVEDGGDELTFPGWISLADGEGDMQLTLVRDFQ
jgi:hypothetical protein